jgi:20S proteasome alpha/beta subunit
MTYVVGAVCNDGIVLVGDKKITIDEGADYTWGNKIFQPFNTTVIGSSGISGMYKSFQTRMLLGLREIQFEISKGSRPDDITSEDNIELAEQVIHKMAEEYGSETMSRYFDALMVNRNRPTPELNRITGVGLPEPVVDYKVIGHGEPYGSVILKKIWKRNISMEDFAKIGCFVIHYIQRMKLDNSVGIDFELNELPQVWFIPKIPEHLFENIKSKDEAEKLYNVIYPLKELTINDVKKLMTGFEDKIDKIEKTIKETKL